MFHISLVLKLIIVVCRQLCQWLWNMHSRPTKQIIQKLIQLFCLFLPDSRWLEIRCHGNWSYFPVGVYSRVYFGDSRIVPATTADQRWSLNKVTLQKRTFFFLLGCPNTLHWCWTTYFCFFVFQNKDTEEHIEVKTTDLYYSELLYKTEGFLCLGFSFFESERIFMVVRLSFKIVLIYSAEVWTRRVKTISLIQKCRSLQF